MTIKLNYKPEISFHIGNGYTPPKPKVIEHFTKNTNSAVLEELLDETVSKRKISLQDAECTINSIKAKYPNLSKDTEECINILKSYKNKI